MTITPNDIANKEFKKVFRGYDADEVDEFLDQIVEEYEKIYKENLNLKEKISTLNEKIEHYANIESTLQNTLVLAQSAAEQAKENSKKEAEMILNNAKEKSEELIKDAQNRANQIISEAQQRVLEINKEYEMLRQEFNMFRSRFKGLLQAQLETIEKFEWLIILTSITYCSIFMSKFNIMIRWKGRVDSMGFYREWGEGESP